MPTYRYRARDARGRLHIGTLEAESEVAVTQELRRQQFFPVEVRLQQRVGLPSLAWSKEGWFSPRPKSGDLAFLCRQLATLVGAGVPVVPALRALAEQTANRALKLALRGVVGRVEGGAALAEALDAFPRIFPRLMVRMVAVGEVGGVLDEVLERLAAHFEREHELYQKIRSALTYPAFVFLAAVAVVIFLFLSVLPVFGRMLASLNVPLPLPTLVILGIGEAGRKYWYFAPLLPAVAALIVRQHRSTPRGRKWWDQRFLYLPVVGGLYRQVIVSRFSRTLATLLRGGLPLLQALEVLKGVLGNLVMEEGLDQVQEAIRRGESLAVALERTGLFPPMVTQMIAVGEESGTLDSLLERVSIFYDREVEAATARLSSLIEPILILVMGGVVGTVVVSVLLPMLTVVRNIR
ncbi:MAG: type II secretion system F family protein [Moorellales bacterium]